MSSMERFTQRARRVLSLAHQEAERMRHNYIGTEHLLLGLIREEGGVAGRVLRELGLDADRVQEIIERITGPGRAQGSGSNTIGTAVHEASFGCSNIQKRIKLWLYACIKSRYSV